tara:strand:- start:266 stop:481 length:216 start_codon:yes stop_codon:yes gene_type:complete
MEQKDAYSPVEVKAMLLAYDQFSAVCRESTNLRMLSAVARYGDRGKLDEAEKLSSSSRERYESEVPKNVRI